MKIQKTRPDPNGGGCESGGENIVFFPNLLLAIKLIT